MTAPDLYREERRNAPRRRTQVGTRRLVPRLPTVVDTEIGARLYTVILYSTVCALPSAHLTPGCDRDLLTGMAEALFFSRKFRLRSVALTSLG